MPTEIVIDGPKALELLEAVVDEGGDDFVYSAPDSRCLYTIDGEPSCLVGQALFKAGVTIDELAGMDEQGFAGIIMVDVPRVQFAYGVREVLNAAQVAQDCGQTWGQAYQSAYNMAAAMGVALAA